MWKQSVFLIVYAIALMCAVSTVTTTFGMGIKKESLTFLGRDVASSDSKDCGSSAFAIRCLFTCLIDPSCEQLGFNRSELSCGCPCQLCPNQEYYGSVQDYTTSDPLTDDQRAQCPDVRYPCNN